MAVVDMSQLKPNSHAYKEGLKNPDQGKKSKEKLKPVVSDGGVVSTKKTLSRKFADTFIEDDIKDVKNYIIFDAIVPGIKNLILDVLSRMFFGEGYSGGGGRKSKGEHYDYSARYKYKPSGGRSDRRRRDDDYEPDDNVDYRNIVLQRREEAESVVDQMRGRIDTYGTASVADLLDLIDVTGKYTDNNWGWDDEREIGIRRVRNGYLIDVSEAKLLD